MSCAIVKLGFKPNCSAFGKSFKAFMLCSNFSYNLMAVRNVSRAKKFQKHNTSRRDIRESEFALKPKEIRKRRTFPLLDLPDLKLAPKLKERPKQQFDYFLVLDFEATCDSPVNFDPQEIIEFPVLKVNADTFKIESSFHSYVKPQINPVLTSFCSELTGIIQGMVENSPLFKEVFQQFLEWLEKEGMLKPDVKSAFATCGDPDLDYLLPVQCLVSGIEVPEYMKSWINVKRSFCEISPYMWPSNLLAMLKHCDLEPEGENHSGIDDAKNVSRVMADLADRGLVYSINGWQKHQF